LVKDINLGPNGSFAYNGLVIDSILYFTASDAYGANLYEISSDKKVKALTLSDGTPQGTSSSALSLITLASSLLTLTMTTLMLLVHAQAFAKISLSNMH
jgi:hypothetical protein